MPSFNKRTLSLFLRNGCERQFVLYLYTDRERAAHNMPSRHQRGGLGIIAQAGFEWQNEKIGELQNVFGNTHVHYNPNGTATRPGSLDLSDILPAVAPYQFIVEGAYEANTPTFRNAVGLNSLVDFYGDEVSISDTRPDVIQILPSMAQDGAPEIDKEPNPYELAVLPNGNLVPLAPTDTRLRLRVIDIKLTSEPGANYFAEVVYYSMTLAAWLEEMRLSNRFVVIAAPAVWPGTHEASNLAEQLRTWRQDAYDPTDRDLINALEEDLEIATFDVFAPRLRRLLTEELPQLLSRPWNEVSWHVDYRCKGCEFLSADLNPETPDENAQMRCYPTAQRSGNLSRVYGLSRGATTHLRHSNILNVDQLATTQPNSPIFEIHQGLKTKRTTFPHRAQALMNGTTSIIPASGGDALMPKWPSLRIYLFMDYDLSSAITVSMAIRADWREPLPFNSALQPQQRRWTERAGEDEIFLVDWRTLERERAEFLRFLRQLSHILNEVRTQDTNDDNAGRRDRRTRHSTYQIYLWDEAQKKHLVRLIGRHLPHILADRSLHELIWLFPPPELLQDADEATRCSSLTIVKIVVENTVALDVPHYYGLIDLGERVTPGNLARPTVHDLYHELFSDLIPMERLHEYWNRRGHWLVSQDRIIQATRAKVYALSLVTGWLQQQLRDVLSNLAAPPITQNPQVVRGIAPVSRLWLGFTKLNVALESLDKHTIRAMPPHERVARFKSAHLTNRLEGPAKAAAIQTINAADGVQLVDTPSLFIYQIDVDSVDVNIQRGEFLYALAPQNDHGFLDRNAFSLTGGTGLETNAHYQQTVERAGLTSVSVEAIDRINRLIALNVDMPALIAIWERNNRFDFSRHVMLDPIHGDFLSPKVQLTLRGIGNPPSATADPRVTTALGPNRIPRTRQTAETPASEILWNAQQVHQQNSDIDAVGLRQEFEAYLHRVHDSLNESQWNAWNESLVRKLALIWGPPGTGKSRTLRAIILGASFDAKNRQRPLRLLVSANTYTAIDNVLLDLEHELRDLLGEQHYHLYRIQSSWRDEPSATWRQDYPTLQNVVFERHTPSNEIRDLLGYLNNPANIVIVGCPPQQLHNLAIGSQQSPSPQLTVRQWFDFIVVDETSQIDVATSTIIFSKRASNGACIVAGDNLQLPPIHQTEAPEDLEDVVESLYGYFRHYCGIPPVSLDVNYRSNRTIVEFTKMAGYSENLRSYSPNLTLDFTAPIENMPPEGWPNFLHWTSEWASFLDPAYPAISFVYNDVLSSQVNDFEADSIAAMTWLLRGRMSDQLLNELDSDGNRRERAASPYRIEQFWQRAVGIVTPHRAQRARVVNRLRQTFPNDPAEGIFGAVDTVERYQGQQRDVIVASFGIGDPDLIEAEDEFLYNLNRFNVLASRARAKIIVFCTQSLLQHLSNDIQVLEESRLLKGFVDAFCQNPQPIQLAYIRDGERIDKNGILRRRVV